jgi:hypothetical protein
VNVVEMAWRGTRHIRFMFNPRPAARRGAPLVRVLCGCCGALVAVVEGYEDGRIIRAGDCRYTVARLDMVACPVHGQLTVSWDLLAQVADRAQDRRRAATTRATPRSMP